MTVSDRSEHGGALPVHEQVLRADVHARLFGPSTPVRIGRFVVERQIGAGGMGTVFAARDEELDRTVAVKVVRSRDARGTDHMRARMLREAKSLAQLSHPNVVAVYEVGEQDDGVFIA
ncbi:MAG: protein kinase, partial [Myxococcota bacterium]